MIFKTFNNDLDGINNKIGFSKRSFAEWGTQVKISFNEGEHVLQKFKNAFTTAFASKKNMDWKTTASGEIVSRSNIDSYLEALDKPAANNMLQKLQEIQAKVNAGTASWNDYFKTYKGGKEYLIDFIQKTDLQKASIDDLINANKAAREAAIAHNNALKQQTLGAKAATIATKVLSAALNTIAMVAIGEAISALISGIDSLIHKEERETEALEDAQDKFSQTTEEIKNLKDELASRKDRINELQELADSGTISLADENELNTLKKENDELERKIALKQKVQADDAKELLEKAQKKADTKEHYSYTQYSNEGEPEAVVTYDNAISRLQDKLTSYQNMVSHGDNTEDMIDSEAFDEAISKDAKIVGKLVDAYKSLTDAGIELTSEQQAEYDAAIKAQDAYLLYSYTLAQTKERFQGLTEEQQRSVINNKLLEKGLTKDEAASVLKHIDKDDLGDYYDFDFNFPLPNSKDYDSAEEYGKAYAEAWKNGVNNATQNKITFEEAWNALDTTDDASLQNLKADLLSLAKQGKLTVEEFNKTTGAKSWLDQIGISAEEAIDKINNLKEVSSADQLASMKTGISSISNILGEKKENLSDTKTANTGIGPDTLGSMPDDIKSCTKEYEAFCEVLGNGSSTMAECRKAANKLAAAFISNNNFLSQLTEGNKDYYISVLQEMGIENADIIVKSILRQKEAELSAEKQWTEATTLSLANATYDEITALANEQKWSEETKNALYRLALQKQTINGVALNTVSDIDNLIALVDAIGGTSTALSALRKLMEHPSSVSSNELAEAQRKAKEEMEAAKNQTVNAPVNIPKIPDIPTSISPSPNKNKKDTPQQIKESKQEIDWLSRMLTILQNKIDILKEKFENLFSVSKKSRNLHSQIKETEKLLNVQEKATARYQKKADSYYKKNKKMLSKNNVNLEMLKNGSYNIKSYKSGIANIIQTFEEYYDKAQESRKATLELTAAIRELSKQKLELKLDDNERKRTYWEAKYANAATVNAKNNIISKEIKTYASDNKAYNQYYSRAKKLRKKESKEAKTAVSKTKGLSKTVKNKIKDKIKQGKEIPSTLLEKVKKKNEATYDKLVDYNNSLDFTADALRDKKLSDEEYKTNRREAKIEKHQNRIDAAEAKYNLSQQRETNATDAKTKNKYEVESLKYLEIQYKHLIEIAKLEGDVTEQKRLQAEKQEKIAESYKKMYDNIKTEYENQTSLNDAQIATVQAQIATLEASGKSATKEIYNDMMKISSDTTQKLLKERAELEKAGKNFEYSSQEWYDWQNDLLSIDQQLESSTQQLIEFQKAINELDLKKFSLIAAQLESANNQIDFLTSMLSHKDLTSKEATGLTDEGLTTISLWMDKMENNKKIIENAQNAMAEYQKQMAEGTTGDNFETQNQTLQEFIKTIQDAALADEDLKDSIINLVEEAFNVQLDVLNELIEKRKKALQTEKNLYDYQRKVASQTKTIASIQKQIAALTGDHSEEARAKLQKLKVNLEEAQQDLKDTEYDKWLSDQEDMLDSMAEEMENFFDNALQNTDSLISAATKAVNENGAVIVDTLKELGYGDAHSFDTKDNGNGTFTSYYTDYNGNQIQITSDQYGNVVKDTAKPDPFASAIESAQNFRNSAERNPQTISWNPLSAAAGKGHMADRTNASIVENKNADNSSVILQRRDSILTPEQTEQFKNFLGITPPANGMAEKMAKMTQPPTVSSTINKPRNVNVGGVTIHLDGSRIIDEQSFVDTLKHSTMIQSAIDESVAKGVTKTYSNTLGRF